MIFSNSKLTGHGGNRFGWAIVKDEGLYKKMEEYIQINTMGVSREAQLRALKLLNVVLEGNAKPFFQSGYATMRNRWTRLKQVLSKSNRFTVQKLSRKYCSFYKTFKYPTPAYAWMKCKREEDKNCYETLKAAGISCHPGNYFSADDRFARVSISRSQDDFEILLNKLIYLLARDGINHSI
ncbi:tryptophan aminotransferase-related protein 4-like [Arachis stenosperma]|uniref:tryptophan aminotransferase-related protein 4-like n=1 Tax=Arachis stenosperma TaxID=217475 RepID=UPI0025ACB5E0|nr:tryptophan aminotransferase-related protein 4-like [Arachis stenosperma]